MIPISAYSVLVTENCNLACKYCYEVVSSTGHQNKKMTPETAKRAIEAMFVLSGDSPDVSCQFFGGEPTLMPEIIDIMCTEGKLLAKETGKRFRCSMVTNATNMNAKVYDVLLKHLDVWEATQLSVDGPWDIQDEYRITRSGKGTFATIEKNLPFWKELYYPNHLNVHGVLNNKSIGRLFESYKYFKENWGMDPIWFLPAKDPDFTDQSLIEYERELMKIHDYIMERVKKDNSTREIDFYAPLNRALDDRENGGSFGKPCGAGVNYATITSSGEIFPCHHFYFIDSEKQLKLGDIWNGVDMDKKLIWEDYDASDIKGCEGCDHVHCYRCIAENYEEHGTPFVQAKGKNEYHCKFMKIDQKVQRKIRAELIEMGLLSGKNENQQQQQDGNNVIRDCVGKQGECPIVTRVEDCNNFVAEKQTKTIEVDDCVGKHGECPVVTRVEDCNNFVNSNNSPRRSFEEMKQEFFVKDNNTVIEEEPSSSSSCGRNCDCAEGTCAMKKEEKEEKKDDGDKQKLLLKDTIDEIISVLVKLHNQL